MGLHQCLKHIILPREVILEGVEEGVVVEVTVETTEVVEAKVAMTPGFKIRNGVIKVHRGHKPAIGVGVRGTGLVRAAHQSISLKHIK